MTEGNSSGVAAREAATRMDPCAYVIDPWSFGEEFGYSPKPQYMQTLQSYLTYGVSLFLLMGLYTPRKLYRRKAVTKAEYKQLWVKATWRKEVLIPSRPEDAPPCVVESKTPWVDTLLVNCCSYTPMTESAVQASGRGKLYFRGIVCEDLVVTSVDAGSPAHNAGVRPHFILKEVETVAVGHLTADELLRMFEQASDVLSVQFCASKFSANDEIPADGDEHTSAALSVLTADEEAAFEEEWQSAEEDSDLRGWKRAFLAQVNLSKMAIGFQCMGICTSVYAWAQLGFKATSWSEFSLLASQHTAASTCLNTLSQTFVLLSVLKNNDLRMMTWLFRASVVASLPLVAVLASTGLPGICYYLLPSLVISIIPTRVLWHFFGHEIYEGDSRHRESFLYFLGSVPAFAGLCPRDSCYERFGSAPAGTAYIIVVLFVLMPMLLSTAVLFAAINPFSLGAWTVAGAIIVEMWIPIAAFVISLQISGVMHGTRGMAGPVSITGFCSTVVLLFYVSWLVPMSVCLQSQSEHVSYANAPETVFAGRQGHSWAYFLTRGFSDSIGVSEILSMIS